MLQVNLADVIRTDYISSKASAAPFGSGFPAPRTQWDLRENGDPACCV